jgi:sugar-specific transcriptional regulator TrmB
MSKDSKTQLKTLIKKLIYEVLDEAERETIVDKKEIQLNPPNTFESYLKQNVGVSFTNEERVASTVPNIRTPFSRTQFEIRYKSTEDILNGGKMEKINKTTVVKKIRSGNLLAYKSFTLIEPTQKPESPDPKKPEPIKVTIITSDSFTNIKGDTQLLPDFLQKINDAGNIGL